MSQSGRDDSTPVLKLELKRVGLTQWVTADGPLQSCAFLAAVGRDVKAFLEAGQTRRYSSQSTLFIQGTAGENLYWVLRGEAKLTARKDDDAVELDVVRKGDVFGEAEFLKPGGRQYSAVAVSDLDVAELPGPLLKNILEKNFALSAYLKEVQARRATSLNELSDFLNRW